MLAWAKQLGLSEVVDLFNEILIGEENRDEILSDLAEEAANPRAAGEG
jgi:ferritin-like metal-binding protein YciE